MSTGSVTHGFDGQIVVVVERAPMYAGNQPRSRRTPFVMSTVSCRSWLIAGSIRAFGLSDTSQWETDDPAVNGFGAYILGRLLPGSRPALITASRPIVTFTPAARLALIALPSAWEMPMHGIVIVGSVPPIPGSPVAALLT